jgi:membrane-bound lytic murein transglycosylase D
MKQFLLAGCVFLTTLYSGYAQKAESLNQLDYRSSVDTTVEKTSIDKSIEPAISSTAVEMETPTTIRNLFEENTANNHSAPKLNPRAVSFVEDYIEAYGKNLQAMKEWALPYFNMMDAILAQYGLPRELKYLAVIESKLKSNAVSHAGAVGPWQLMRGTAVQLGLKVNKSVDERKNYVKSTHAAAKYLKDLYKIYGDWLLVIAAYNAGPGSVQRAIARSGSRDFWDLQYHLPTETRKHVKKFIGTHYIFEGQGGLTTLTKAETQDHYGHKLYAYTRKITREEEAEAKTQAVAGKYQSVIVAKHIMMDHSDFLRYNPDFDKVMARSSDPYEMKLPAEKMELFNANKYAILQESVQLLLTATASIHEGK